MHILFCIFCTYLCIWQFCIYVHILFCIFQHIMLIMHIYCTFLMCLFEYIPAYLVLHIAAYFVHISAHLNLHIIMAYSPSCIFKHTKHISAYKMHIYAYCLFFTYIAYFSFAYGTAYFVHVSVYFDLHIMTCLPLCIFKLISAYL